MSRFHTLILSLVVAGLGLAVPAGATAAPGALDTTFGTGGVSTLTSGTQLNGLAVQSDGELVAVGSSGSSMAVSLGSSSLVVERFSASGAPEGALSAGSGVGRAVVVQSDGKIVVAGNDARGMVVERFNVNGSLDTGFGSRGVVHAVPGGHANALALGPNGTIVAAGQVPGIDGFQRIAILRLNANGSPDSSLGTGGVHVIDLGSDSIAKGIAVQGDGKIVLAGVIGPGARQVVNGLVARLTSAGALDPTFGHGGTFIKSPAAGSGDIAFNALTLDPAGAILVGGGTTTLDQSQAVFARLSCSGALDGSFAGSGVQVATSSRNFATDPFGANAVAVVNGRRVVGAGQYEDSGLAFAALWGFESSGSQDFATAAPSGAEGNALAVQSSGNLVVAGTNVPAGFAPSGFVARYVGFGAPASGTSPCGGPVIPPKPPLAQPTLTKVGQSHRTWGEAKSKKHKRPVGTTFFFTLNESASVKLTFTQRVSGRKVKGKCAAQTNKNRHGRSCKYTSTKGTVSIKGHAGNNRYAFTGSIPHREKLRPGTYTVTIAATNAAKQKAKSRSLTFKIVS